MMKLICLSHLDDLKQAIITKIFEIDNMNHSLAKEQQNMEESSELGKKTCYDQSYNPDRLYAIPREGKRKEIGINSKILPFSGFDLWNHYEVSWLNNKGKPMVALAEIYYDCHSPFIVESKSLKLYFNSLNNTKFDAVNDVEKTIQHDLERIIDAKVTVSIRQLGHHKTLVMHDNFSGECIDKLDVECTKYTVEPAYLATGTQWVEETLYSDLLKSNCLVTNQPDWGSVQICYQGKQINREGLLRYLVSFRQHNEFHEQCIERIFVDLMTQCKPDELTVYGRYTRRGGLDINPCRSTKKINAKSLNFRLPRQ